MRDYSEIRAVSQTAMPELDVKLYLSRDTALNELGDLYTQIHQEHDSGAVSNIVGDSLLVVLMDLNILYENHEEELSGPGELDNESMGKILGVLSHEAYHLARRWMEWLGEDRPGEEEMAFHVGNIAAALYAQLLDYFDGEDSSHDS